MTHPVLKVTALTKRFTWPMSVDILKGVDLTVYPGEAVAIIGKSGEGKTTLLHLLGALDIPCSGEIEVDGVSLGSQNLSRVRSLSVGFIFQNSHLLEEESVLTNALMPARIARYKTSRRSPMHERALRLLDRVGLAHRALFPAKLLSGGERQRLAIARALCNDPPLLLADEPTGNLDSAHAAEIYTLLLDLVHQEKKALLVVTHDAQLAALCHRKLSLHQGLLI